MGCGFPEEMSCPMLRDICKSPPMKPLLLFIVLATMVSCTVSIPPPPGMPLDRELRPGAEQSAITKVTG